MNSSNSIEHKGLIESISGDYINVLMETSSACVSCNAKGICGASEIKEKRVDIHQTNHTFSIGETVSVVMNQSYGYKALMLGYVLPFLVVFIILIAIYQITGREGLAGLVSILALFPYYGTLYLRKNKLKDQIKFTLKKST